MATTIMTATERAERVRDEILNHLEKSSETNTTLLPRGDTTEIPLKDSSQGPAKKKETRRSTTRESRGERARSLSRGLSRSLSKLRSRSRSALRRRKDKSKKKNSNEQPKSPDHVPSQSADKVRYPAPDRHSLEDRNSNKEDDDSVVNESHDHDRGKGLMELFERQQRELKSEMSASISSFDKEAKYWKKKAKALQEKYEGETGALVGKEENLRELTANITELKRTIKDNERESGEKIKDLESQLEQLAEEKEELKSKASSSAQRAFVLEQKVKDRDASVAQLRNMLEKAEQDSESRIELLERQLEKLVEMKSRPDSLSASQTLSASQSSYASNAHTVGDISHESESDASEVKSLEALLVRILAEKDKLAFENENLRALVKQNESSPAPATHINLSTYQLSCRNCIDQTYVGQTKENVKQKVRDHFSELWYVAKGMDVTVNTDETFMKSSFAQHVAGHCAHCQSSEEVVRWCVKNIKVEKISKKFSGAGDNQVSTGKNLEF